MSSDESGCFASDEEIQSEIEVDLEETEEVSLEPVDADESIKKRKAPEYDVVETTKEKKIKTLHKKPPTADELNRLRDTESLFHSNIFRLQIEELLSEMKGKEKHQSLIEKWIQSFKDLVVKLPESGPHKMEEVEYLRELNVVCPLLESRPDKKTQFRFIPPKTVTIIGSHLIKATTRSVINVDIGIAIPERCFRDKDAQDYRYFRKRALYMAYIAGHLKSTEIQSGLKYCTSDNPFLPVLEVTPAGKLEKSVIFILRPYGNPACFKVAKFFPSTNNIRASWISNGDETNNLPTPKYNAAMLREILLEESEKKRREVFENMPAASDTFILLKVWLHQRNLDEGFGAFTPFIISMYMVYLAQQKKINMFMSSYQLLRNVLLHLGEADLSRSGITLCKIQGKEGTPTLNDFASNYEVIFVDDSGFLNICASVSLLTWNRVRCEAALALKILDSSSGRRSFDELFMTPNDFLSSMDHIVRIDEAELEAAFRSKHIIQTLKSPKLTLLDSGMSISRSILPSIVDLLQQALNGRTSLIALESRKGTKSEVDSELKNYEGISLGFVIDPEKDWNPLIKGPEADQIEEAKKFRNFWGEKAQLRRFQDGTICEAVVFPATNLYERRLITKQIVTYILERHLNIKNLTYVADQLENILKKPMVENYGSGEEANAAVMKAMESLGRQLRDLSDAPLTVTSIQGTSPAFRCTDVFPPIPGLVQGDNNCLKKKGPVMIPVFTRSTMPTYVAPMEVILTLEASNKWPDDLKALRRLKAAFYITICKELSSKYGLIAYPTPTFVDVLKDGFVFRLRIAYPREVNLARTFKDTDGVLKQRDTAFSIQLEKDTVILPKLSGALYGLQSQYPSFGTAARLAKRWIAGHMLSLQVPELVTELLVASIYLDLPPGSIGPISPQIGFLQFLRKVARTNWSAVPLILNFNKLLGVEEIADMELQFSSQRSSLPPLVLYTSYTKNPKLLTADGPTLPVLARAMLLASETLKLLEDNLSRFKPAITDLKMLFRPATTAFDAVIRLNPKMVAKRHMNLDAKTSGKPAEILPLEKIDTIPLVGFEPVSLYIEELKECYGDIARFFYDSYGGFAIGVLWDKDALGDMDFKVSNVKARKLNQEGKLSINFGAIVQDFSVIGKDLVDRVEINFEKWISPDKA